MDFAPILNNPRPLIMVALFLVLILLPIRLHRAQLMVLAFVLWLMGGLMLVAVGAGRIAEGQTLHDTLQLALGILAALIIGFGKGKFMLGKASQRNIDRLNALAEPQRPVHVYGSRSWMVIGLMVGISVLINTLDAIDPFWRGIINLAIGMALIVSSFTYLRAMRSAPAA
jgi:hypothetical protein